MVLQALGVDALVRLMRLERIADSDTSWLLHGPADDVLEAVAYDDQDETPWRYAAE